MIGAYLTDTVYHVAMSFGSWGERSQTVTSIRARVEWKSRVIRNLKGELVLSTGYVLMKNRTITPSDKIRISSTDYPILAVNELKDFTANKFIEVYLG